MWLVAVVGRCLAGCEHLLLTSVSTCFGRHYAHLPENKGPVTAFGVFVLVLLDVDGSSCGALSYRM